MITNLNNAYSSGNIIKNLNQPKISIGTSPKKEIVNILKNHLINK